MVALARLLRGLPGCGSTALAAHLILLAGYLVTGVAVTWPRVTYLAGRLPATRDAGGYVWDFWWVARQVSHCRARGPPGTSPRRSGSDLGYHTLMPLPGAADDPGHAGLRAER